MPRATEARRAGPLAGAAFVAAGLAASAGGAAVQLGFAAAAILTIGLAHGASDLSVVPAARRPGLVACYLAVAGLVLAAWLRFPVVALGGFLLLSAAHFGLEDAPADRPAERVCRGILAVAAPALLHRGALAGLFSALTGDAAAAAGIAGAMAGLAVLALALLPAALASAAARQGRGQAALLLFGTGCAVLLPPLAGFALSFVLLHAWPQLVGRMERTGDAGLFRYMARHRATVVGAGAVVALTGWLFADRAAPALFALFAGLAAVAVPHMTVTPLFEAAAPRPRRAAARGGLAPQGG